MKMRLLAMLWLGLSVTVIGGCGEDEDNGEKNNGQSANPNPPVGDAVPSAFSNTATSQADLESKTNTVKTEIVGEAKTELGITGATSGFVSLMMAQATGEFDASDQAENFDIGSFGQSFAEGDDCSSLYGITAQADEAIGQMFTYATSQAPVAEDFSVDDSMASQLGYTVEVVESDRYAWHYKLKRAEGGMSFFAPALEMAMGATETEVALLVISDLSFSSSDFGGEGGEGQTTGQDFSMSMVNEMNMYANTETKTAKVGMNMAITSSGQESSPATNMQIVSDLTIQAGQNPSMVQNMTISGTSGGEALDGYVTMSIIKVGEGTYKFDWSGSQGGQTFASTLTVSGNATTCSVESVEMPLTKL